MDPVESSSPVSSGGGEAGRKVVEVRQAHPSFPTSTLPALRQAHSLYYEPTGLAFRVSLTKMVQGARVCAPKTSDIASCVGAAVDDLIKCPRLNVECLVLI